MVDFPDPDGAQKMSSLPSMFNPVFTLKYV